MRGRGAVMAIWIGTSGFSYEDWRGSFYPADLPNREALANFRAALPDLPVVIEFRNSGWVSEETFTLLRELELGFCCVDEPRLKGLMPPVVTATSPIGYVRFHGRNAAKWWQHEQAY